MIPSNYKNVIETYSKKLPIDLIKIANELGLSIFSEEMFSGISGVLKRDKRYNTPSEFVILVNENDAFVRQRFTAAHEIGHYLLHHEVIGNRHEDNFLLRSIGTSNKL